MKDGEQVNTTQSSHSRCARLYFRAQVFSASLTVEGRRAAVRVVDKVMVRAPRSLLPKWIKPQLTRLVDETAASGGCDSGMGIAVGPK